MFKKFKETITDFKNHTKTFLPTQPLTYRLSIFLSTSQSTYWKPAFKVVSAFWNPSNSEILQMDTNARFQMQKNKNETLVIHLKALEKLSFNSMLKGKPVEKYMWGYKSLYLIFLCYPKTNVKCYIKIQFY